jgi:hypothetical protein
MRSTCVSIMRRQQYLVRPSSSIASLLSNSDQPVFLGDRKAFWV